MSKRVFAVLTIAGALMGASVIAAAAEPPARTPELVEKGKASFERNCVACHGEKGEGNGPAAAALDPKPRNLAATQLGPKAIFKVLATGKKGTAMIAFTHLPEEERWALAYFVDGLAGKPDAKK
jgi:mono/diheme cytochrome c family protein